MGWEGFRAGGIWCGWGVRGSRRGGVYVHVREDFRIVILPTDTQGFLYCIGPTRQHHLCKRAVWLGGRDWGVAGGGGGVGVC